MQQLEPIRVEMSCIESDSNGRGVDSSTQSKQTSIDQLFTFRRSINFHEAGGNTRVLFAPLQVCKTIRSECLPLFFSTNTFHLTGTENQIQSRLIAFTEAIGDRHTAALRSVILDIGELNLGSAYEPVLAHPHGPFADLWDFLLRSLRTTKALKLHECRLRARATFVLMFRRPPFACDRKVSTFELDSEDVEDSWQRIFESGRRAFDGRLGEWSEMKGMLEDIREGLGGVLERSEMVDGAGVSIVQ